MGNRFSLAQPAPRTGATAGRFTLKPSATQQPSGPVGSGSTDGGLDPLGTAAAIGSVGKSFSGLGGLDLGPVGAGISGLNLFSKLLNPNMSDASKALGSAGDLTSIARYGLGTDFAKSLLPNAGSLAGNVLAPISGALGIGGGILSAAQGNAQGVFPGLVGGSLTALTSPAISGALGMAAPLSLSAAAFPTLVMAIPAIAGLFSEGGPLRKLMGGKDPVKRKKDEAKMQAHASTDIVTGLRDLLQPGLGLDVPGIDVGKPGDYSTDQLLASINRAQDVFWNETNQARAGDWDRKGGIRLSKNAYEVELYKRLLDAQDELERRGAKVDPIIYGPPGLRSREGFTDYSTQWQQSEGGLVGESWHPGSLDEQTRLLGGDERMWTLAQMASRLNEPVDPAESINAEMAMLWLLDKFGGRMPEGAETRSILDEMASVAPSLRMPRVDLYDRLRMGDVGSVPLPDYARRQVGRLQAKYPAYTPPDSAMQVGF